jgi:hypothetical protein
MALFAVAAGLGACAPGISNNDPPPIASTGEKFLFPAAAWNCGMPEGIPVPEKGTLVFRTDLKIDQLYDVGNTLFGHRRAIVLAGGTITSEKLQATVQSGSLDFELTLSNGVLEVEQILMLRTSDGRYILCRSAGAGPNANDLRMVYDFEAPTNSSTAWLNSGKFVGRRVIDPATKTMTLSVFDLSGIAAPSDPAQTARIIKPLGVPPQPWDYRKADPAERQGDAIVTEFVALGPSQNVGPSKYGRRNVIPITGGTLSGTITGKVLPGGADYQNLSAAPAIDARYLWQADNGEIILVRNAGLFGSLSPTFEARVDGKFAWLNEGKYRSSNPGMSNGGVTITFYKSD